MGLRQTPSGQGHAPTGRGRSAVQQELIQAKKLNEREIRTLDLLAGILENKEIANELGVSVPVAEKILRNVFRKLGVHKRAEAILLWKTDK
jgi:DNA-binding CsgD family transcriptional regulator